MKNSSIIKILFLTITLLFTSCEKKKQIVVQKIDNTAEIKKILEKAKIFYDYEKNDSSIFYFNKAILLCEPKSEYADDFVHSSLMMATILQKNGNFYEAETTITKVIPYLEKTSQPKFTINAYSALGYNYYRTYDYEKALNCYRKSLKNAVSTFRKSSEISNIAFIYVQQKKYKEAIDLLEPLTKRTIIDKVVPLNTHAERAAKLYHLGLSYLRLGNHQKQALDCFNESLKLTLISGHDFELIPNYYALYLYYKKYNNQVLKKVNAQKAYDCSRRSKSMAEQITTLGNLIEADNVQNTRKHWEAYIKLVDSTTASLKTAKNQFTNIIYDSNKDKEENLELKNQKAEKELQLQREKNRSTISYVIILTIALVFIFLSYYIISKAKKENKVAAFKSEIRLSNKLHQEVTEEIYKTLSFLETHELEDKENKEKFISDLNNIYIKTRKISRENSVILTDDNYVEGLKEMISGYTSPELNIIVNGLNTFSWSKIDRVKKITVFRIIQEIFDQTKILNSATLASVTFKKEEKHILITYCDNNKEVQEYNTALNKKFENIENRLKSVKGFFHISLNTNQGFKFFIKLPI
ncbi:M48 family metallopeptidase [Flavobacterium sp. DG2-3]|uniref:tetratricopeptide repeat protein n=1 Tax=Flavobacterium sp. DG2-3 TaxID=3068317 RepID=UPI00273DE14B|nr:tetratricopeptide repeat-containing sensor histidine kinase [Flavobacterium sp. DG2-3]MDP5202416.1 tetratricopeptide repeat protein [Flavobacterium sp. DG2-3]